MQRSCRGLERRLIPSCHRPSRHLRRFFGGEILWNDSLKGFQAPNGGAITLAIYAAPDSVSYCSHKAGVCVRYMVSNYRNWEEADSSPLKDDHSDEDALLSFVGKKPRKSTPGHETQPSLGRELAGAPAPGGILWMTKITLATRAEIVRRYRQMRSAEMEGLRKMLTTPNPDPGTKSITISCFAPTDPTVHYYVNRSPDAPVIMSVFWDRERQEWAVAGSLERSQGPERFEEVHRIIDSIACSTVRFR